MEFFCRNHGLHSVTALHVKDVCGGSLGAAVDYFGAVEGILVRQVGGVLRDGHGSEDENEGAVPHLAVVFCAELQLGIVAHHIIVLYLDGHVEHIDPASFARGIIGADINARKHLLHIFRYGIENIYAVLGVVDETLYERVAPAVAELEAETVAAVIDRDASGYALASGKVAVSEFVGEAQAVQHLAAILEGIYVHILQYVPVFFVRDVDGVPDGSEVEFAHLGVLAEIERVHDRYEAEGAALAGQAVLRVHYGTYGESSCIVTRKLRRALLAHLFELPLAGEDVILLLQRHIILAQAGVNGDTGCCAPHKYAG